MILAELPLIHFYMHLNMEYVEKHRDMTAFQIIVLLEMTFGSQQMRASAEELKLVTGLLLPPVLS